jgi:hypothetical protein
VTPSSAAEVFQQVDLNVGVLLGAPSGGLIDIDLDCPEALRLAAKFLPATRCFGRRSKPSSHWLFVCDPCPESQTFVDAGRAMLLELRSTGQQTVFPGSVHESGEAIEWANENVLAQATAQELFKATARLAAAAFLLRRWTAGRDDLSTALIGALLRDGWPASEANSLVETIAAAAGDEELNQRLKANALSRALQAKSGRVPGWTRVGQILGKAEAEKLRGWLPYEGSSDENNELIHSLNSRHAIVMVGGQCRILNEVVDPATGRHDITLSTRAGPCAHTPMHVRERTSRACARQNVLARAR